MARIRMAYIGGGSTRGAGTMASFIHQGENFDGSEVVLIDLDPERLDLIRRLVRAHGEGARARPQDRGHDRPPRRASPTATRSSRATAPAASRRACSTRRSRSKHGIIGQETQGPGGFFMALRAIHAMQGILADVEDVCPDARIFNYTNPVNVLAQAVTTHSDVPFVSLCEGPIYFADQIARAADLDRDELETVMVGLNHACWSVKHEYKGADAMPLVAEAWERRKDDPELTGALRRQLRIAAEMDAIPADYFQYYYCQDEVLAELQAKPTTRAEDILGWSTGYWEHYAEQAESDDPKLDPKFSRGGIHELELAIDAMDAVFNKKDEVLTVNVPNTGGMLPGLRRVARRRAARPLRRPGRLDPAAAGARAAAPARARARARARRVPGARGRRGLGGHAPRCHPRARRAPADGRPRPHRARLRRARARAPRAPSRAARCPRSLRACSTSGSTAATPRRSRSSAAPTAASRGTRARAAATSTPSPIPTTAVDEIVRAATDGARARGRWRGGLRVLLAGGRRLAGRHRVLRGRAVAPHPGAAHGRRQRRDRRDPLRGRGRRRLLARVRHGHGARRARPRRPRSGT